MTKRWCTIPLVVFCLCFLARALVWLHFRDVDASAADLLQTFQQTPMRRYEAPSTTGKIESPICANASTAFALASLLIANGYEHDQYMQGMCKLGRAIRQFATIDSILLVAEVGVELNRDAQDQIARCGWRLCFVSTISQCPPARVLAVFGHGGPHCPLLCARAGRGLAPAPALVADTKPPCCIDEPFGAQQIVPTDCTVTAMQRESKQLCAGRISARFSGRTRSFGSITSLLPVFLFITIIMIYETIIITFIITLLSTPYYLLLQ